VSPREVITRLSNEIARIAATPAYRALLEKNAFEVLTSKPQAFPAFVRAVREKWGKVMSAAGIRGS
jgi:tripartite-type tricarboxylate transporter receptor subunit TctC